MPQKGSGDASATTSEAEGRRVYEVEITPEGLGHLNRLPDKVRLAALESIFGPIADNPHRLGRPLIGELDGLRSARRGTYRIIYEVFDDDQVVLIHRVQHRRHAYRAR
ncbi:MAG: type II toxin-antitoxin system RelE/ParE family toxin [Acidimicrobiia bacterium]|nr:type II toxin-antitoxin system RelE/ParE family toxin [Acidimicrobiia bacterium]